ncbi:hypothetical protein [Burkholderia thailandensis]|uniref:hypothetical protein n=1 Tax=Burkholderia thailandensis TaxID=57975 RepID=UPI0003EC8DB7|nr:hypothetical protein [Burkholderia thailandensis]AHI63748.1 phage T7 tail fiber family protein [Burkholderia thailandensis H0587]AOJ50286.1 hypothetical protein AQ475_05145 [Burkholderia thailandensis]AVR25696.1 hypothetical protein A8H32_11730 [Burkholderia thailandensis]
MTVSSPTQDVTYNTDGSSVAFPIPFYFLVDSHVAVDKLDSSENIVPLILGTDYTVSGAGNELGGSLTTTIAYPDGYTLHIYRIVPVTQETEYQQNDPFPAKTTERALDKLTMIAQQNDSAVRNSIRYPLNEYGTNGELPAKPNRINTLLGFDSLGTQVLMPLSANVGAGDLKNEIWTDGIDYTSGSSNRVLLSRNYTTKANLGAVVMMGVTQDPDSYGIVDGYLVFNAVIPAGISKIWCYGGTTLSLNVPAQNSVGDDELAWGSILARQVDSIAAARALPALRYGHVKLNGYFTKGDGGGGAEYYYDPTDLSTPDDGFSCYHAADGGRMKIVPTAFINAKQAGCRADATFSVCGTGTDDTAAAQTYLTWCNANARRAYFPSGAYRFSAALNIDNSAQNTFPMGRASIIGDGPQNTSLQWDNGPAGGLAVKGSVTNIAATSMQTVSDLSLIKADNQGTGGYFQSHSHLQIENVWALGWNNGFDYEDVQESYQKNVVVEYCVIGLHASRLYFTLPNVLSFYNCTYGSNKQGGLDLFDATTVNYDGGSIESNNDLAGGSYTPIWGCRITLSNPSVNEGSVAATFKGVYFERNGSATAGKGLGDIYLQNDARDWAMSVLSCNFNRGTTFSTNQIGIASATSGGARGKLILIGNGHDAPALGGYPGPSTTRPYVGITGTDAIEVIDTGNYYQSPVEAPNYTGAVAMPLAVNCAQARIGGSVRFNGTNGTSSSSFGVASVTRTGTGTYSVAFARNQPNVGARVYTGMVSGAGTVQLVSETAAGAVFLTENYSGVPTDYANVMISWAADPAA